MLESFLTSGFICMHQNADLSPTKTLTLGFGKLTKSAEPPFEDPHPFIYVNNFGLTHPQPYLRFESTRTMQVLDFLSLIAPLTSDIVTEPKTPLTWTSACHQTFTESFEDLQHAIRQGALKKGVLKTHQWAHAPTLTVHQKALLLKTSLQNATQAFIIGIWGNHLELFGRTPLPPSPTEYFCLAATPEVLFFQDKNVLTTAALAATIPHHMSDNALLQNPKMLLEHDLVIADLIQALTPYPTQSGPTQVKKLKHLKHLFTPITTLLDPKAAFCNWFSRLHPSAAVGWFPRSQDAQLSHPWQKNMQNYQQLLGLYAGVFGLYLGGDLAFGYVLLRAVQHLQLSDQLINAQAPSPAANFFHTPHYQWLLAAGAGVIAQSEPEHEWQELLSKLNAIRRQIPIESL